MHLQTGRLDLFPCQVNVGWTILRNRAEAKMLLGARLPADWPAQASREFLSSYVQRLKADPSLLGWGIWLMVHTNDQVVIGDLGFKGQPDVAGTVEIGYSVVPLYRRQGYAVEAVRALVSWAFAHEDVQRIIAECSTDNVPSIRILEKLGMQRQSVNEGLLKWELRRAAGCTAAARMPLPD